MLVQQIFLGIDVINRKANTMSAVLRNNSQSFGELVGRAKSGSCLKLVRGTVTATEEKALSLLVNDQKFSLLATHLINVCGVPPHTIVCYGRVDKVKLIIALGVEHYEKAKKIQSFAL